MVTRTMRSFSFTAPVGTLVSTGVMLEGTVGRLGHPKGFCKCLTTELLSSLPPLVVTVTRCTSRSMLNSLPGTSAPSPTSMEPKTSNSADLYDRVGNNEVDPLVFVDNHAYPECLVKFKSSLSLHNYKTPTFC